MKNITWTTTTIGKQRPFYTTSYGKWEAKITDQVNCCELQILCQGISYERYYSASVVGCKNQFRRFLKKRGQL